MDPGKRQPDRDLRALTLAVTAGVLLVYARAEPLPWAWLCSLSLIALLPWRGRAIALALVFGLVLANAHAQSQLARQWPDSGFHETRWVTGSVASLPEAGLGFGVRPGAAAVQSPTTWRFVFAPDDPALPARIRVSWYRAEEQPRGGDCLRLLLRLRAPHGSLNPAGFDYEQWLFRQHIGATATVKDAEACAAHGHWLLRARQAWVDRVDRVLPRGAGAALLKALTVGDTGDLHDADWAVFRRTGTTHLIAISGFNLAIVSGAAFFLLRWLWVCVPGAVLRLPAQRFAAYGAAALACVYAGLAGFEPPVARALFMLLILLIAAVAHRLTQPSRALAAAWLPLLILDPCVVLTPGLWLSFGAVAAIFYLSTARWRGVGGWRLALRVQVFLSLVLAPLTLYYFNGLSWLAVPSNLLMVPIFAVLTPIVVAAALLSILMPASSSIVLPAVSWLLDWVLRGLSLASDWIPGIWWAAAPSAAALILAVIGALCLFAPAGLPLRRVGLSCLVPICLPFQLPPRGGLELTALDVGQGLAVLVRTAHHSLLFDAGPAHPDSFDAGASVVVPAALKTGLRHIDTLVLSHGDNDHAGGVGAVRDTLRIDREIGTPDGEPCHDGMHWHWDGVHFRVLHPATPGEGGENDDSCVLRIDGPFSVLLPGDIERRAEERLLRAHADELRADVLLAPHHGSASSSTTAFVRAVRPKLVIFSSGWRNRFRHPRPDVVARYRDCGADMQMTGESGAVTVISGATGLQWSGWRAQSRHLWNALLVDAPYWRSETAAASDVACEIESR